MENLTDSSKTVKTGVLGGRGGGGTCTRSTFGTMLTNPSAETRGRKRRGLFKERRMTG